MATTTVTELITKTVAITPSASSTHRAAPQGGIIEGGNPAHYDPKNPIVTFIIQAGIVIIFCRLLHWPLSKMRQPRVIAEVIGGILLGPSVMGRIPGFTDAIFPKESIPNFTLVANLGLVLFLFLVGLEVDLRFLVSNWRVALSVGAAGMALPFGLGCAISYGLYHEFRDDADLKPVAFGTYMLFVAIAMAITAFPVLCRILTELKLLGTSVGIIVLSAGVGNDVVGWILLALCVALVNANNGLTALWVLFTAVGWTLFLVFVVRPGFMHVLRRTRSLQDGPSQSVVALTLLMALTSAFFTQVIGIHAIFGAFLAGLICPHEGGFAVKLTEKIEDLISALFLPLYFALSGLSTNLGLLDTGTTWAYVFGVTGVAFFAKVIGGSGAARLNGLVWRECLTIGSLMSCKGLVELIVLNIGLQAKILSTRTFTIFVVMALVTTFATTPLTSALYPPWYQKKLEAWKRGEIDWDTGKPFYRDESDSTDRDLALEKAEAESVGRMLAYLRIDNMPGMLAMTALFGGFNESLQQASSDNTGNSIQRNRRAKNPRPIEVHGVRLLQLTERESSVMAVSEVEENSAFDPVVNTFRAFGRLHCVPMSGEVAVVPESYYADTLVSRSTDITSDLLLLPWSETGSLSEFRTLSPEDLQTRISSGPYQDFVRNVLNQNKTSHTAIFVNNGFGGVNRYGPRRLSRTLSGISMRSAPETASLPNRNQNHHFFLPFFGSPDDRVAVRFVLQLARDARLSVTIVHFRTEEEDTEELPQSSNGRLTTTITHPSKKDQATTTTSESIPLQERNQSFLVSLRTGLSAHVAARVDIQSCNYTSHDGVLEQASMVLSRTGSNAGNMVVLGRNVGDNDGHGQCLGPLADALATRDIGASLLVVQARRK